MAGPTDPKMNVKRAEDDPKQAEKMRMLKELAKMTKPAGSSAKGKSKEE